MPKIAGNEFWWSEVDNMQRELGPGTHYKVAETHLFYQLYHKQLRSGVPAMQIKQNFEEIYGLGVGAFYRRLKKAGYLGTLYSPLGGGGETKPA